VTKWVVVRSVLVGGAPGSIQGYAYGDYTVQKARSKAKHSNGVEWLIFFKGREVEYSRKLANAKRMVEEMALEQSLREVES
jgi:hypothetical protein